MTKNKIYKYLGRNGNIVTPIVLEKIDPIPMLALKADKGKLLTDGQKTYKNVSIFLDEVDNWYEIDDPEDKKD